MSSQQNIVNNCIIAFTPTIIVPLIAHANNDIAYANNVFKVRTLLDSGSEANWIARDILKFIKHTKIDTVRLKVRHFNGVHPSKFDLVQIYIKRNDNWKPARKSLKDISQVYETLDCLVYEGFFHHRLVKGIREYIKNTGKISPNLCEQVVEPSGEVSHHDINLGTGLVLSNTGKMKIMEANSQPIILRSHKLMLEPTVFGYAVSGKIPSSLIGATQELQVGCISPQIVTDDDCKETSCMFIGYQNILCPGEGDLEDEIRCLWEKEHSLGVLKDETHSNDDQARLIFKEGVSFDEVNNQYVTPLPFNGKEEFLKSNEYLTRLRTRKQHIQMLKDVNYMDGGCEAFQKMVDRGAVERVTKEMPQGKVVCFLPWRFVVNTDNKTTTFRMCMDASARPSAKDYSLNQCLLKGPNMTMNLAKCLIRFMLGRYRTVADFEKAFLMILIMSDHRDALRFFWPKDPKNPFSPLEVWRFRVVLFGSISSPFLLAIVLDKVIAEDILNSQVKKILQHNIYVDNLNCATNDVNMLVNLYKESREVFLKRGFNLRKWSSNCQEVQDLAKKDQVYDESSTVVVLGMLWEQGDILGFKQHIKWDNKNTKRSTLSFTNGMFDPMNRLLPIAMQCRLFIRILWDLEYKWDLDFSKVPELAEHFANLRVQVYRCLEHKFHVSTLVLPNTEVHVFCDASTLAFGAVLYLVTPPCAECPQGQIQFIKAKGKLAPPTKQQSSKEDTVPRWELQSMVTAGQLVEFVLRDIEELAHCPIFIWGDNKPALCWCSSSDIADIYVFRRVSTLRKLCPKAEIRYVKSADNPADILTKPISAESFLVCDLWWQGPQWLLHRPSWPVVESKYELHPSTEVQMHTAQIIESRSNEKFVPKTLSNFFSDGMFMDNLKVFAYAIRWRDYRRVEKDNVRKGSISADEFNYVKVEAIKIMQAECFSQELKTLKSGKLVKTGTCRLMQLFLDDKGIIRCASRVPYLLDKVKCKAPVLVIADHPYIISYIKHKHMYNNCNGTNATYNVIKWLMHGPGLRRVAKEMVRSCRNCIRVRATPYHYPKQPELPQERLRAQIPFCSTGVDYCGPFEVRSGYGKVKMWICLFTCLVSRAVYLVPVRDLKATTFLDALWELSCRRAQPTFLYSDNGTYFTKTAKLLDKMAKDAKVKDELSKRAITWKFIPPYSPWQGGIFERCIRLLKTELDKMCGTHIFTEHNFRQNLFEIERVLNNRPLTFAGQYEVITPAHILGGGNPNFDGDFTGLDKDAVKESVLREQNDLPHLFRQAQERLSNFWQAFWDQYLVLLRFSADKVSNRFKNVPKIGDLCIVWDKDPRKKWKKAIITELIYSSDGKIRQCKIKMDTVVTIRPVNQLYSLELTVESYLEADKQSKLDDVVEAEVNQQDTLVKVQPNPLKERPKRLAALAAMERNRELMLSDHYFK